MRCAAIDEADGRIHMNEIEIGQIDIRFEMFRLKDKNREKMLLASILEQGIREPLLCVIKPEGTWILLDGFKRLRGARRLGMKTVPVISLGTDEAAAILRLIRASNARSLNILERSMMVDKLKQGYGMSIRDIAHRVERSPAWVSVRLGLTNEMSEVVRKAVFSGDFPVRSYMYTLRVFTRVNKIKRSEIDIFVKTVSGKGLSTRDIDILAYAFFRGGAGLQAQMLRGNLNWTLKQLRRGGTLLCPATNGISDQERQTITDLELAQKYIGRVMHDLNEYCLESELFYKTVGLLISGISGEVRRFIKTLEVFNDQRGQEKNHPNAL